MAERLPYELRAYHERAARAKEWLQLPHTPHFVWKVAANDVPTLLAEVERLRAALEELVEAHDAPPWGGDDPTYEKALAAGRRMDAAWDRAREALEPVEGVPGQEGSGG